MEPFTTAAIAIADAGSQLIGFARSNLGLSIPEGMKFAEQLGYCRRNWVEGTALIIYDDVQQFRDIQASLPLTSPKFKVLLTSRQRLGTNIQRMDLDVLPPEKALELLQSLVIDGRIEAELEQSQALCGGLGYLPLAIELVGRYLDKSPTDSITEVQAELNNLRIKAEALLRDADSDADMTAKLGVAQAFELSYEKLSTIAQQLGWRLSLFAPTAFNWEWVEACHPDSDLKALKRQRDREFLGLNLLQYLPTEDLSLLATTKQAWFRFHPLIREFFAAKQVEGEETEDYQRRFCEVMVGEARKIEQTLTLEQIKTLKPTISHLEATAKNLLNWFKDEDIIGIFKVLGCFYQAQGLYGLAEPWLQDCCQVVSTRLGDNHPSVATSLNNLAVLYQYQGRYEEAELLHLDALAMYKRLLGDNHCHCEGENGGISLDSQ